MNVFLFFLGWVILICFFFKDKARGDARVFYLLVRVYLLLHSKKNDIFIIFLNKIFINESCQTNIIIYYLLADVASVIFPRGFYSSLWVLAPFVHKKWSQCNIFRWNKAENMSAIITIVKLTHSVVNLYVFNLFAVFL